MNDADSRRRVATRGDELIRGIGLVSDVNSGTRLRFKIDGIQQPVTLDTVKWRIHWEDVFDTPTGGTVGA